MKLSQIAFYAVGCDGRYRRGASKPVGRSPFAQKSDPTRGRFMRVVTLLIQCKDLLLSWNPLLSESRRSPGSKQHT